MRNRAKRILIWPLEPSPEKRRYRHVAFRELQTQLRGEQGFGSSLNRPAA